jgi:large subunit ribosomal protein L4e
MSSAARPVISVFSADNESVVTTIPLPAVLVAPIRPDVVRKVHTNMAKNKRQAYAVSKKAGHQTSAESWGTGRAVARIPRVPGGGTHRAGQGAFGNMCRGGRMFAPTKTWRRWHRMSNLQERRFAVCSALAASALPALVMARGHKIDSVPEIPLVLSNSIESTTKTGNAVAILKRFAADVDVQKAKDSKKIRCGKGKMRNRRYVMRRGPLVIYNEDSGITKAFRNIAGVELCHVTRLNLLTLAPGGHMGRFIVWTQGAFEKLDSVFGTFSKASQQKKDYKLPFPVMYNSDLTRIINSDEIQSKLRPAKEAAKRVTHKKNPLKNLGAMLKLNPYAKTLRRAEILASQANAKKRAAATAARLSGAVVKKDAKALAALKKSKAASKAQYAKISA